MILSPPATKSSQAMAAGGSHPLGAPRYGIDEVAVGIGLLKNGNLLA